MAHLTNRLRHAARTLLGAALLTALPVWGSLAEEPAGPGYCDRVAAFDQALQLRYYRANMTPVTAGCRMTSDEGCRYWLGGEVRVRITHLEPIDCGAGGDCRLRARQTCEGVENTGAACRNLMINETANYEVVGDYQRLSADAESWRLNGWWREPSESADLAFKVSELCPGA